MNKEKQIEEIANDLNMHCCSLAEQFCGEMSCNSCITNYLYNAGYRKASEVAEEIFAEIEEKLSANLCGEFREDSIEWFDYYSLLLAEDIAELKKKYTDERE